AFGYDRRRLRPNVVIGGVLGLAEREWEGRALRAGATVIGIRDLRQRCIMTTFDPDTLEQDVEVLKGIHRRFGGSIALNAYVVRGGTLSVGDPVELIDACPLRRPQAPPRCCRSQSSSGMASSASMMGISSSIRYTSFDSRQTRNLPSAVSSSAPLLTGQTRMSRSSLLIAMEEFLAEFAAGVQPAREGDRVRVTPADASAVPCGQTGSMEQID